jgi:hypothetical protein
VCTLTWARARAGYELFFNRDELKTRLSALPPAQHATAGVRWLGATDGDAGGTWLGVNERGVSVGLLNRWESRGAAPAAATSRGVLVAALLDLYGAGAAEDRLRGMDLRPFKPFSLAVLEPESELFHAVWDGERLACGRLSDESQPLTSSSSDPEGAARNRRALWMRLASGRPPSPAELFDFHRGHEPSPSGVSTCMHRADAETVSFTHVAVGAEQVALSYRAGPACRGARPASLVLARSALHAAAPRR